MLGQLLILALVYRQFALVHSCFHTVTSTACNDILTSTANTNSATPLIAYSDGFLQGSGNTHASGVFAVISCSNIATTQMLLQQGSQTAFTGGQLLQCSNGVWSNSATFTCVTSCPDLAINSDSTAINYGSGHDSNNARSIPGTTAQVSCNSGSSSTNPATGAQIFEGTTPASATSALGTSQTYTCSTSGTWARTGGSAQTQVQCLRPCGNPAILNSFGDFTGMTALANVPIAHGTTVTAQLGAMESAAAIPCDTTTAPLENTFKFTDGSTATQTYITNTDVNQQMTCNDGDWFIGTITGGSTVNKLLASITCGDDFDA